MAKVAVERAQEVSGVEWDDEDKGEEITHLLEKAGYDVMATEERRGAGLAAVEALLEQFELATTGGTMVPSEMEEALRLGREYIKIANV